MENPEKEIGNEIRINYGRRVREDGSRACHMESWYETRVAALALFTSNISTRFGAHLGPARLRIFNRKNAYFSTLLHANEP